jgi:hypothetical protein
MHLETNSGARGLLRRLAVGASVSVLGLAVGTASASAALTAHGQLLHLAPHLGLNANSSNNWFGYDQGTLEQGGTLFNAISGQWTVPTASQHTAGQAEASSDWIGIGGGCVDAGCTVTDSTLIQTGTEQDVSATGQASYSAWWEIVPVPSLTISSMTVRPGDHMSASVAEVVPDLDLWKITISDVTRGETYSTTVPYASTHLSAEWIEETPLEIGTSPGLAALPNLTNPGFDHGTVNGAPVQLKPSEAMDLTSSSGQVIGTPSAPDSDADGFGACAWATACAAPAS